MKSRLKVLFLGVALGVVYAFLCMLLVQDAHKTVSITYVFILPIVLGTIPVLLSTKAQLNNYLLYLIAPVLSTFSFFILSFLTGFEGLICLVIIVGPFLIIGGISAFFVRLYRLKNNGDNSKKLYFSLLLPLVLLFAEDLITPLDYFGTVENTVVIHCDKEKLWENVKNVKAIKEVEIKPHFIHWIGIPKPVNGEIDIEKVGGVRSITWQKGLKFKEVITDWKEMEGFSYDIIVNPEDIPPQTLDEHVMIGGKYFDAINGYYKIIPLGRDNYKLVLSSTYRITSTVNFYGKWCADYIFHDFHSMILEVIKGRCERNLTQGNDL